MEVFGIISDLASFGAAGLMGALWICERRLSRRREEQLSEAHDRITRDEQRLGSLTEVVQQNTAAVTRFTEVQRETCETLRRLTKEMRHARDTQ